MSSILLAFYLASILTYFLASTLAFYLASILTFYLASILTYFLASALAFYLASILTFFLSILAFYLASFQAFILASILTFRLAFYSAFCHVFGPMCAQLHQKLDRVRVRSRACYLVGSSMPSHPLCSDELAKEEKLRRKEKEGCKEGAAPLLQSRDPRLAGGEQAKKA